jgi:transposase
MALRDAVGPIYDDASFAALFARRGRPAEAPWRLALVTVMQFAEGLSDRQAAEAVRARIDWKYALGLELTDPGFDFSVLSEFRARLVNGSAEHTLLERLLAVCRERGWLKARATADGLHPRAGRAARAQSARTRSRDASGRPECHRSGGARLAAVRCSAGLA